MRTRSIKSILLVSGAVLAAFVMPKGNNKRHATHYTKAEIAHGAYLVMAGSCNDCHSPKVMTAEGPVPDQARLLSGAPENEKLPDIPSGVIAPDKWAAITDMNQTTWVGPWGVSFSANLTPDSATGIGGWSEEMFVKALREGKYWGNGRPLLPPMPWQGIGKMSKNDLRDMYAYLMTIKPVHNMVHAPIPPEQAFQH